MPLLDRIDRSRFTWLTRGQPVLLWLGLALIPAFALTAMVTAAHRDGYRALAAEWQARASGELSAGDPNAAVESLRNALRFAREDRTLRLRLAESLAAAGRAAEARAYLLNLRDAQPGSSRVNLALARLAASDHDVSLAHRYYHDAIEGAWPADAEARRRETRLELAAFLVSEGSVRLAEAELVALSTDLPDDRPMRLRVAGLFAQAGVHGRALALYQEALEAAPRDAAALTGAGSAALASGDHARAVSYLRRAAAAGPLNEELRAALETSSALLDLDPNQRRLTARQRAARVRRALAAARTRLSTCTDPSPDTAAALEDLAGLLRTESLPALARDPDRREAAMLRAFRAEQAAGTSCAAPLPIDRALLLMAADWPGSTP